MAECTIEELREAGGCPPSLTLKQVHWAQLQILCLLLDWFDTGTTGEGCDVDVLLEEGRCTTASVIELEYWKTIKLCELLTEIGSGGSSPFINYAAAGAFTGFVADRVYPILGATVRSDGGEGFFYFNATSTTADDGGTVLRPDNIAVGDPGRLIRMVL